jgi:hypothetical protein
MNFTGWKKAQKTHHEENACVQVGTAPGYVGIRDTKHDGVADAARTVLVVSRSTFAAFITGLRG